MYTVQGKTPLSEIERSPHGASLNIRGLGQMLMQCGNSSLEVFELAEKLEQIGYPMGLRTDPHLFDAPLEQAVMLFQREHGLPAVGTIDYITLASIDRAYENVEERPTGMMLLVYKGLSLTRTPKRAGVCGAGVAPPIDGKPWPLPWPLSITEIIGIVGLGVAGYLAYKMLR